MASYDLTFSGGPNGEQSTMVMGEGRKPTAQHLRKLGLAVGFSKEFVNGVREQTQSALSLWRNLAKRYDVIKADIELVIGKLN